MHQGSYPSLGTPVWHSPLAPLPPGQAENYAKTVSDRILSSGNKNHRPSELEKGEKEEGEGLPSAAVMAVTHSLPMQTKHGSWEKEED